MSWRVTCSNGVISQAIAALLEALGVTKGSWACTSSGISFYWRCWRQRRRRLPWPTSIIDRLNNEINAALADPKIKARLEDLGATVLPGTPADFGKLIAEETEKWGKVVRAANIKPD